MKKAIILSKNSRFIRYIKTAIEKNKAEVETNIPLLHDLEVIKNSIIKNKNTSEIRVALANFISANKFPYIIVLDYRLNLDLPFDLDPDENKILRTFFIAFMILSRVKGLSYFSANFLIIANPKSYAEAKMFKDNIQLFLKTLYTKNEKVNKIIAHYISNEKDTRQLFNIEIILDPQTGVLTGQIDKIQNFIDDVETKYSRAILSEKISDMTPIDNENHPAAKVLFKYNENVIFDDTVVKNIGDKKEVFEKYNLRTFYILGYFTNRVKNFILKKIEMAIWTDVTEELNVKKTEQLTIAITPETIIDGSVAATLFTFISKKMRIYNFQINVDPNNMKKLSNSPNFEKLQNYIIKNL